MTQIVSSLMQLASAMLHKQPNTQQAHRNHIKKRHWCAGSFVIIAGSWITHTTTATISDGLPLQAQDQFAENLEAASTITPLEQLSDLSEQPTSSAQSLALIAPAKLEHKLTEKEIEEQTFESIIHKVKRGESLGMIFRKHGMDTAIPHYISQHATAKTLVSLSVGKPLEFKVDADKNLRRITYPTSALQELVVELKDKQIINAEVSDLPYVLKQKNVSGEIKSSLYESASEAGLSNNMVMEMARIFGWDIDFVLDIRRGDSFHVVLDEYILDGKKIADGNILAAEFTTQGRTHRAIRFEDNDGVASYYTPSGESMLGTFLRSPVKFSRISSRFGNRKHPISKKWKAHKGVDYAASRGTPIRATADGKVVHAGRKGGYGNTVVLRHAGRFSTLYAHMKGFAKGIHSGARVEQGQTIGYVGSTGYSTGPHLHYEFRVNGVHHNSLTYKTPKASSVNAELKDEFLDKANSWVRTLEALKQDYMVAKGIAKEAKKAHNAQL